MGAKVYSGAMIQCTCGATPTQLLVMPTPAEAANFLGKDSPANMTDNVAYMNIQPFAVCSSAANPTVVAASAASGTLVPTPCQPAIVSPWSPGDPQSLVRGAPAITTSSTCMCAWGGVIMILSQGNAPSPNVAVAMASSKR